MSQQTSFPVHGQTFLKYRQQRGWSQEELARRSGYSVRLIRKAESGGTLKYETLQNICEALSQSQGRVTVEQITCDILSIAKCIVESYDNYGPQMLDHCAHLLAEDFVYTIHADPARVPYAGSWHGLSGMREFLKIFFGMFTRKPGILKPAYLVGDQCVHARFLDQATFQGEETPEIYINLHLQFRGHLVCKMDNEFDSDLTVNTLTEISENGSNTNVRSDSTEH